MNLDIYIRPLEETDINSFLSLHSEALLNSPEAFGSDYESYQSLSILELEDVVDKISEYPHNYVAAAFTKDDDEVVGMTGFSMRKNKSKQQHKGYIWGMYVSQRYRNHGLGQQLIEFIIRNAQEETMCEHVLLNVASSNKEAYNLYTKLGFIQYGTEIRALKLGEDRYVDEILMLKMLE
jgi:ribosomal protein S18 acetylase RimI-like enzyme